MKMRPRGNIRARYDLLCFGVPAHHRLMEFGCRVHGSSYRYHVYVVLRLDRIKSRMTWNHFSGFFFTLLSNAAISQGRTSQKV
jgi:hypothetical protein